MNADSAARHFNIFNVASVSPKVSLGNPEQNVAYILNELDREQVREADFVVMPELCITGYTCADLFFQKSLITGAEKGLISLCEALKGDRRLLAVGAPLGKNGRLYNCAVVLQGGRMIGAVPKTHIPNYQEFYEKRWFASGEGCKNERILVAGMEIPFGTGLLFNHLGVNVGLEICEDLWVPTPPSSRLCQDGADIILNLSATDDNVGKYDYICNLVASQSGRCRCVFAYASAGNGESSTDLVFSGINLIAYDGEIKSESERFSRKATFATAAVDIEKLRQDRRKYSTFFDGVSSEVTVINCRDENKDDESMSWPKISAIRPLVNPFPFIPSNEANRNETCREIVNIQSWGLAQRLLATGCKHLVVGISGGLDSTLALLTAHFTFRSLGYDTKGIIGVTMPAEATSKRTRSNAAKLMQYLGVTFLEIPIREAVEQHFDAIGHSHEVFDATYENSQARERTQILMDLANKHNGMVLGTGDMSELALGWCTYNGDHMSMYNVNAGVPKTLVRHLVRWYADTSESKMLNDVLTDIIDTPISPELIPANSSDEIVQKTEELVGPYELHDFFLYHVLRNGFSPSKIFYLAGIAFEDKYSAKEIKKWLVNFYKRFFSQQFKRSCMPDGPKIGSVCLSPRGDWRMPSDASAALWLEEARGL